MLSLRKDAQRWALLNEGLPFNTGVEYIFGNAAPSPINSACDNYTNPSPCPRLDSMAVVVRFAHDLGADGTLFCTNRLVDSIMVNPTPEPTFALDAPQACLDTAEGNCIPLAHDLGMYDICRGRQPVLQLVRHAAGRFGHHGLHH